MIHDGVLWRAEDVTSRVTCCVTWYLSGGSKDQIRFQDRDLARSIIARHMHLTRRQGSPPFYGQIFR